jgi:hypothetical protein
MRKCVNGQRVCGDGVRGPRQDRTDSPMPIPALKSLARDTSQALALLDVDRLEELRGICERLLPSSVAMPEAMDAKADMAVLGRVLEAARANAEVMQRLRAIRVGPVEYSERQVSCSAESASGHD